MKKLAIATHSALINGKPFDGLGNVLKEALFDTGLPYYFIRNSMDGQLPSIVETRLNSKTEATTKLLAIRKPALLRYVTEFICTFLFFSFIAKSDVYIGIDPLNTLPAVCLKKIGRIKRAVFFTPDYSPVRFQNGVMNNIYHAIDRFCVKNSDEVWSVSNRIKDVRRQMGLPEEKNILIPNVPPAKFDYLKQNKKNRFILTTNGIIDKQLDFLGVLEAMKSLEKDYPQLEFHIVGTGPLEREIISRAKKLGLDRRVKLLGHLSHDLSLEAISKSGIGLALYTGAWGFNKYGDSTKCREYLYFGLPLITTNTHSTVEEIRAGHAGLVVDLSAKDYAKAIKDILKNYNQYSNNSKRLGNKYHDIHRRLIMNLMSEQK